MIPIYENYGLYKPRMNVRKMVDELLMEVAPEYLQGLGSIVLSSQTRLPRKDRRKKFLSRGRKIPSSDVLASIAKAGKDVPHILSFTSIKSLPRLLAGCSISLWRDSF